jgi:proteic killer suppression protein
VKLCSIVHKGLKQFYLEDITKGVPAEAVGKLRKILAYLDEIEDPEELRSLPTWKAHKLTGSRRGIWSLHVTRNWRVTLRVDSAAGEIWDVNFEDYH